MKAETGLWPSGQDVSDILEASVCAICHGGSSTDCWFRHQLHSREATFTDWQLSERSSSYLQAWSTLVQLAVVSLLLEPPLPLIVTNQSITGICFEWNFTYNEAVCVRVVYFSLYAPWIFHWILCGTLRAKWVVSPLRHAIHPAQLSFSSCPVQVFTVRVSAQEPRFLLSSIRWDANPAAYRHGPERGVLNQQQPTLGTRVTWRWCPVC